MSKARGTTVRVPAAATYLIHLCFQGLGRSPLVTWGKMSLLHVQTHGPGPRLPC